MMMLACCGRTGWVKGCWILVSAFFPSFLQKPKKKPRVFSLGRFYRGALWRRVLAIEKIHLFLLKILNLNFPLPEPGPGKI